MSASVEIRDLVIRYGDFVAVERASLEMADGSFAALVGPSGCGKTSILRAIAGFETPQQGVILIGGSLVAGEGRFVPPEQRQIGMMFQEGALFPHLTVAGNVAFGASPARARAMLQLVGMESMSSRFPHELSGGQQQRVALARALAPAPRVVLLDEPFDGLDASLRVRLRHEVREILRATGTTAILVTHDQEEALSTADQVSVMQRGRILQTATAQEIYDAPVDLEVAALVGDAHLVETAVAEGELRTPFGALRCDLPNGPCFVRIRTEDLCVVDRGGTAGVVVASRFFGHDVVDEIRLEDGRLFRVRLPRASAPVGSPVEVALQARHLRVFCPQRPPVDLPVEMCLATRM